MVGHGSGACVLAGQLDEGGTTLGWESYRVGGEGERGHEME